MWLAIALCAGTAVTLLDEPLNALDAKSLAHLRSALLECAQDNSRAWIVASNEELGAVTPLVGQSAGDDAVWLTTGCGFLAVGEMASKDKF